MLGTEPQIIDSYVRQGQVKIVYRHLLQLGEGSLRAGEANECAGEQGKFWEMRDVLYRTQYSDVKPSTLAQQLGLDVAKFDQCTTSRHYKAAVEADYADANEHNINSRPVFDINGTRIIGAQGFGVFQKAIDEKLR